MGRPDVDHEISHDSNGEKMICGPTKQEVATQMNLAAIPTELGGTGCLELQYFQQCFQSVWERQILPCFVNANNRNTYDLTAQEPQIRSRTYWYLASLFKNGFTLPTTIQPHDNQSASLDDYRFNLELLAEVAYAHSSSENNQNLNRVEDHQNLNHDQKLKHKIFPSAEDNRCRRIRNNEACRKSRLRRKQINAATKEKLASLSHDNYELKRKIVNLEEEVRAAKNALMSKIESHSKEQLGEKLKLMMSGQWCGLENSGQTKELEGKGSVEHMQ